MSTVIADNFITCLILLINIAIMKYDQTWKMYRASRELLGYSGLDSGKILVWTCEFCCCEWNKIFSIVLSKAVRGKIMLGSVIQPSLGNVTLVVDVNDVYIVIAVTKSQCTAVTVECEVYEESRLWPQYVVFL